ncbi:MAG: xanthine dehydrogenase family protein subunit M [Mariprofundaceae bacterium]|nr:xanthine dehydrogenase family protein subunit M [Mariprofundaceae bacterium]
MKPGKFTYHAPESLDAAFQLLAEHGDDAKIIAGGQSLVPVMNLRLAQPEHLIDINALSELGGIREENDHLMIGSLTRHAEIEVSPLLADRCALLPAAAKHIGHHAIRNRGTIGGSLSNADPAAEWSLMAILLDAQVSILSTRGERQTQAQDFIQSVYTVDLETDEIIAGVTFPSLAPGEGWGLNQICRRAGDFAIVSVAATITLDSSGNIENLRTCLGSMDVTPFRLRDVEQDSIGKTPDEAWVEEIAKLAAGSGSPESDMHASAEYRREMAAYLTTEVLNEALKRCRAGV